MYVLHDTYISRELIFLGNLFDALTLPADFLVIQDIHTTSINKHVCLRYFFPHILVGGGWGSKNAYTENITW